MSELLSSPSTPNQSSHRSSTFSIHWSLFTFSPPWLLLLSPAAHLLWSGLLEYYFLIPMPPFLLPHDPNPSFTLHGRVILPNYVNWLTWPPAFHPHCLCSLLFHSSLSISFLAIITIWSLIFISCLSFPDVSLSSLLPMSISNTSPLGAETWFCDMHSQLEQSLVNCRY